MTNEEAKQALFEKKPVKYKGVEYSYITGIIYRYDTKGKLIVSAELMDKCGHSVVIAQIKDIDAVNESK